MNKLFLRTALMVITLPVILALLFFLPFHTHVALNILITAIALIGSLEVKRFILKRKLPVSPLLPVLLGTSLPVSAYLVAADLTDLSLHLVWICVSLSLIFASTVITKSKEDLPDILSRVSSSLLVIIYPGFFLQFLVLMTGWDASSYKILFFLSLVFANDIMAYIIGKIFGKRRNLLISPNKSLAGFTAGILSSLATAVLFYFALPRIFTVGLPLVIFLGATIGLTTIWGDLIESALKRSAELKDSGTIMLGRGGILDSLDSILLSAPLFYLLFPFLSGA